MVAIMFLIISFFRELLTLLLILPRYFIAFKLLFTFFNTVRLTRLVFQADFIQLLAKIEHLKK